MKNLITLKIEKIHSLNDLFKPHKMSGYIISEKEVINVKNHTIYGFDVLCPKNSNISIIENNKVLYVNNIMINAMRYKHVHVIEWHKKSGLDLSLRIDWKQWTYYEITPYKYWRNGIVEIKYYVMSDDIEFFKSHKKLGFKILFNYEPVEYACYYNNLKALNFFIFISNVKKIVKLSKTKYKIVKKIRFKTKKRYFKGYKKN